MTKPAEPAALDPLTGFHDDVATAIAVELGLDDAAVRPLLSAPPRPDMGDVAVACHRLARAAGESPPAVAARLSGVVAELPGVLAAEAAGPFLNVRWVPEALARAVLSAVDAARDLSAGLATGNEGEGTTWVIDFSSPNAARKLGFHHLRGTAVGAALARLYEARGHRVVRLNHLGDYGHNIALLLYKLDHTGEGESETLPPERLQALYVEANEDEAADPETVETESAAWLALLNEGDETARARWRLIVESTMSALDRTYERLGIHFDEYRGESRYAGAALEVSRELVECGVAEVDPDGGAVFVPETDGHQAVVLVTRRGASTYESRDAAAAVERHADFDFARCVYLTDVGQGGRFDAVFSALVRAGRQWAAGCEHVGFGQMRLGGQKAKTREGRVVSLDEVLDEAVARAREKVTESAEPDALADPGAVAETVGIGAVLFSQCRMRRLADFEFDLEDAVEFRGETAPRIQYAYARIMSILRKGGSDLTAASNAGDPDRLTHPAEQRMLKAIAAVAPGARRAYETDDPSYLADAVIEVADSWAAYQNAGRDDEALRVLCSDPELRESRLRLAAATALAVRDGLAVLGVGVPDRM